MIGQTVKYIKHFSRYCNSQSSNSNFQSKVQKTALILDKVRVGKKEEVMVRRPDGQGYGSQSCKDYVTWSEDRYLAQNEDQEIILIKPQDIKEIII
jgi:hypothetical protein